MSRREAVRNGRGRRGRMVDVLETGLLKMRGNGRVSLLNLHILGSRCVVLIFLVVIVALAGEIIRAFVLMRATKL